MLNFLKLPKHSSFEYKPRFFDPDKEELDKRVKAAKGEGGNDSGAVATRMRTGFKYRSRGISFSNEKESKNANKRVIIIIGFLVVLSYFLYVNFFDKIPL